MAARFWVGGTGNWDASTTTNWSATSGGAGGQSVPTSADTVTFDANSGGGTVTITATATCSSLTTGAHTGTLNTNGQAVNVTGIFSISGSGSRTVTLGASAISCGTWTATTTTNLTFNANTSTITQTGATIFNGGALTYNAVSLTGTTPTIAEANTFATLTRTGTAVKTNTLTLSANQTISGTLTINGNSAINRVLVGSDTIGTARTLTAATVSVSNADFQDITGAGTGSWDLSAISGGSGNCGGNTDITFTTAATQYYYKASGSANWSAVANWYLGTGGSGGAGRVSLPQDTARFDAGSFGAGSMVVTQDMPRICGMDWTGATNTPEFSYVDVYTIYGSVTLISGMTIGASTAVFTFGGRGNYTIDCGGNIFMGGLTINAPTATITLKSNFTVGSPTTTITITNGALTAIDGANNWVISTGKMTISAGGTITLGSATHLLTALSGTLWRCKAAGTVNANTSTIKMTGALTGAISFGEGETKTYYNIWNATTNAFVLTMLGSCTFNDFKIDAGRTVNFTAATTQTVNTFTALGATGNLITLRSTTTTNAILTKAGGGTISCDYMDVDYITGNPDKTWYMGLNSVDGGHNTRIYFTEVPPPAVGNFFLLFG